MKKILISLIILISIFINCLNASAISEEEAKKYMNKYVFFILGDTVIPCSLYGKITDVTWINGKLYVIFHTYYKSNGNGNGNSQTMLFLAEDIDYIRENKNHK